MNKLARFAFIGFLTLSVPTVWADDAPSAAASAAAPTADAAAPAAAADTAAAAPTEPQTIGTDDAGGFGGASIGKAHLHRLTVIIEPNQSLAVLHAARPQGID